MQLDIFIDGETVDLCIPTLEFVEKSDWYKWFNHPHTTMYLNHGIFPNTREKQIDFFKKAMEERLLLIIANKEEQPIGVISLSNINYKTRIADLGIVIGVFLNKNPLEALEAVARITEHAFLKMGLKCVYGGQHIDLIPWSHRMSLIGYRLEGIFRNGFVKGSEVVDALRIAAHFGDYQKIIASRNGKIWDSQEKMLARVKALPKQPIHKKLQAFFAEHNQYYDGILSANKMWHLS